MNIENHINNAKNFLDQARDKITAGDYHTALEALSSAYSNVRELLQQTYELERESKQASRPAREDS